VNIETFLLCDAAQDYGGKLSVLGAFDAIFVSRLPTAHPHCALALRLRFERVEEGPHGFRIGVIDQDGTPVVPALEGNFKVVVPPGAETTAVNMALNLQGLPIQKTGTIHIDLAVDGQHRARLPLLIRHAEATHGR
jgi:hypothetical protein